MRITNGKKIKIMTALKEGVSYREVADRYKVSISTVQRLSVGRRKEEIGPRHLSAALSTSLDSSLRAVNESLLDNIWRSLPTDQKTRTIRRLLDDIAS